MTSNLGSHLIQQKLIENYDQSGDLEKVYEELRVELFNMLRLSIRPEFINRIDEIILFKLLSKEDLLKIVELQLKRVQTVLHGKEITLKFTDEAKEWLARLGFDPTLGARPLKRVIQKQVVNKLSERILTGELGSGDTVEVGLDKRGLIEFVK